MVVRCWTTTCHQNIFSVTLIQVSENLQAALNTFFPQKIFPYIWLMVLKQEIVECE